MINFNEIKYKRINYSYTKRRVNNLIKELEVSTSYNEFIRIVKKINKIQNHIEQFCEYSDICNMRDSSDIFYQEEMKYWNKYKPKFDLLFNPFYEICFKTKYCKELESLMPPNFFNTIEFRLKINTSSIIPLQVRDNELKLEYRNLVNEKVLYNNKETNITVISKDFTSKDRNIRKKAHDTYNDFFLERREKLENIYYEMINNRNELARKLGFSDYSEYSIYDLRRFDYNYNDIKIFRNFMKKYFTPLFEKIIKWKQEFLNIKELKYYDEKVMFKEMPELKYKNNSLLEEMTKCLSNIDNDLASFYKNMLDNNYIDFEPRNNKAKVNITNYLTETCMPVITGGFKETYFDIVTLTHEYGHSYQKYNASLEDKKYIISPFLKYPTFDIAEMFSHAMELITIDYVNPLFSKDSNKYPFILIANIVSDLLYFCLVDEYQEKIYKEKELTKEDISKIWLQLASSYGFKRSNSGHKNLDTGGYLYRQNHMFTSPFYFIDYAISYFGAISLWQNSSKDLSLFKEISRVASYYPLKTLLNKYNIGLPFYEENVKELANFIDEKLNMYYNNL